MCSLTIQNVFSYNRMCSLTQAQETLANEVEKLNEALAGRDAAYAELLIAHKKAEEEVKQVRQKDEARHDLRYQVWQNVFSCHIL